MKKLIVEEDAFYSKLLKSCHPKHSKTNIPFILTRRIFNIAENNNISQKRLKKLEKVLVSQECPQSLIRDAINQAFSILIDSDNLLKLKQKLIL